MQYRDMVPAFGPTAIASKDVHKRCQSLRIRFGGVYENQCAVLTADHRQHVHLCPPRAAHERPPVANWSDAGHIWGPRIPAQDTNPSERVLWMHADTISTTRVHHPRQHLRPSSGGDRAELRGDCGMRSRSPEKECNVRKASFFSPQV